MGHNIQKKIALFNDYTGFGKCAVTVQLPIISHLKLQCCPVPTAILSNHTAYDNYFFDDYTVKMRQYLENWDKLGLRFEGACTGFLGSAEQIEIVKEFMDRFLYEDSCIVVDPIMGDGGNPYKTYTADMCLRMKELVKKASVITPNITEACILAEVPYKEKWSGKELKLMAEKLSGLGPEKIVITGIETEKTIANYVYVRDREVGIIRTRKIGTVRCGTGDVFSSIIAADAVNGVEFIKSVKRATAFVSECLKETIAMGMDSRDGVAFENVLYKLN